MWFVTIPNCFKYLNICGLTKVKISWNTFKIVPITKVPPNVLHKAGTMDAYFVSLFTLYSIPPMSSPPFRNNSPFSLLTRISTSGILKIINYFSRIFGEKDSYYSLSQLKLCRWRGKGWVVYFIAFRSQSNVNDLLSSYTHAIFF